MVLRKKVTLMTSSCQQHRLFIAPKIKQAVATPQVRLTGYVPVEDYVAARFPASGGNKNEKFRIKFDQKLVIMD